MKRMSIASSILTLLAFSAGAAAQTGNPFNASDSSYETWAPKLVSDAVMPTEAEIAAAHFAVDAAFTAASEFEPNFSSGALVFVERQDYSALTYGASCVGKKFVVGGETFARGLGTHANSRLIVKLPEPCVRFGAKVGLVEPETRGSVQFAVESAGVELWRSETVTPGETAVPCDVSFKTPVDAFVLIADTTDDGPTCDQANWLEPEAVGVSGKRYDLCLDGATPRLRAEVPFSFDYGGISSRDFLNGWDFSVYGETPVGEDDEYVTRYTWTDPKTKLVVEAVVRTFDRFTAADWILTFTNEGTENTPIISNVKALDAFFDFGVDLTPASISTLSGDSCDAKSWSPTEYELAVGNSQKFAPSGGRSSNGAFPFWNVAPRQVDKLEPTDGLFFALGWSGQWNAEFSRPRGQRSILRAEAGLETFASTLLPGETIRTPRALVMPWKGNLARSQALFRRLLMFEYAPKVDGLPVRMEFLAQCFDRYYRKREGWEKIDAQIEQAKKIKEIGGTAYWFDAAWFPVGFPNGVGNWFSDKENFPNGVEELGDALEEMGLKFILWFEPERVAENTEIATKHPQFVFGGEKGGLFKLNDPEARAYLTETLLKRIKEFKVGVYRNDFNLDPYPYWTAADAPDRKGMTETRYVEGQYETWDRILSENPGLWIDNCASGGRRIDLETLSRSIPLWRSDTCCWPDHPEWDQSHTIGLAQFLPLFSCSSWSSDPYTFRSAANPGSIMQYNFLDSDYDPVRAKASLDEAKTYQKFWYGDFYPLTTAPVGKGSTVAWQLHRADLDAGLIYVFRQSESPYPMVELTPQALDPAARYAVTVKRGYDVAETLTTTGADLAERAFLLKEKGSAIVVEYRKID